MTPIIRLKPNKRLAKKLRNMGFGALIDSVPLRTALGLPIRTRGAGKSDAVTSGDRNPAAAGVEPATLVLPPKPVPVKAPKPPKGPLVSVIVPAFNVAGYLEASVESVLTQSHQNLEIVIVDDGSTDTTGAIADRIAKRDRRVRVVHKANAGLGAARNTGLEHTSAPYVTFVDSDDFLTSLAIETMLRSLEESGSDFAIGAIERFDSQRTWVPEWVKEVHDEDRIGVTVEQHPEVLWDVFVWNKLFRRSVWDSRVGLFPEGVLYEDQECTARLYIEGAKFDCLVDPVYRWRLRDDGTSITQHKNSVHDLEQRLLVARIVRGVIRQSADPSIVDTWYAKLLGDDLFWYLREVPRADQEFWELLHGSICEFFDEATPEAITEIRFDRRIVLLASVRGSKTDFDRALFYFLENGPHWRSEISEDGAYAGVPLIEDLSFEIAESERSIDLQVEALNAVLVNQRIEAEGAVVLEGYAYVPHLASEGTSRRLSADLVRAGLAQGSASDEAVQEAETAAIPLTIRARDEPQADVLARDPLNSYRGSGFEVRLTQQELRQILADPDDVATNWTLRLVVSEGDYVWETTEIRCNTNGTLGRLPAGPLTREGCRWLFERGGNSFSVAAHRADAVVKSSMIEDNLFTCEFSFSGDFGVGTDEVIVEAVKDGVVLASSRAREDEGGNWSTAMLLPDLVAPSQSNYFGYDVRVRVGSGHPHKLEMDATAERRFGGGRYGVHSSRKGHLQIERYTQFGEAENVELVEGGSAVRITGVCHFDRKQVRQATPSLMMWSKNQTIFPHRLDWDDTTGRFVVDFSLTYVDVDGRTVFYPPETYLLGMLLALGQKLPTTFTLVCSEGLTSRLPKELTEDRTRLPLRRRASDGGLVIAIAAPFAEDERGVLAQAKLGSSFSFKKDRDLRDSILFESFGGRAISDSPKAIDSLISLEQPGLERFWTVRDFTNSVPDGATPVLMYSRAWYEALETSKYLVNNNNFPHYFRKKTGQVYVQTWHGTPLKRIGNDVPSENLSLVYRDLMKREGEQYWDYLLAQTPEAGEILAGAFNFQGRLLTSGYPRNDALVGDQASLRRSLLRRHFCIADAQRVVLYAPTWRDNLKGPNGKYLRPSYLDYSQLYKTFGRDVVVLVRGHANNSGAQDRASGPAVIDVSAYPDINDLYLASDVLITDYSSAQFDYVNTGKPILYLAPDLDAYRDVVRGFYFDFEECAPGPIVKSTPSLVDRLKAGFQIGEDYETKYAEFKERFAPLDDGDATRRVLEAISTAHNG